VKNPDIASVRVGHTRRGLRIQTRFVDLSRSGTEILYIHSDIRTNERLVVQYTAEWDPGDCGDPSCATSKAYLAGRSGLVKCDLRFRLDFHDDTSFVRIPRSCLSSPRWVRVSSTSNRLALSRELFEDDSLVDGPDRDSFYQRLSKRIYSG
jgi:hypothetical protein